MLWQVYGLYEEITRPGHDLAFSYPLICSCTSMPCRLNGVIHRDFRTSFVARGDVHSAKCVQVPQPLDAGVRSRDSYWCCLWRSWDTSMRALRVFRMVSSILRQSFLQTGFETPEEICEYLERAQLHPTGRHWVDNLITPTLVAHQLIRSERERGVGFYNSSASSGYYLTFSSLDTTTMQGTSRGTATIC